MGKIVSKVINGELYTAEFRGMACAYALRETLRTKHSEYQVTEFLFNEILVAPEVGIDDFESLDELQEVRTFLLKVALGNTEKKVSKGRLKRQVEKDEWACWRLIWSDMGCFDYNTVFFQMTPLEIEKANLALDKVHRDIKKQSRRKK